MSSKRESKVFRTVTFRLALWFAALLTASSLGVFVLMYLTLTSNLTRRADETLLDKAREFEALYQTDGVESLRSEFRREAESYGVGKVFFRLLSPRFEVLAASDMSAWEQIGSQTVALGRISNAEEEFETVSVAGRRHRVRMIYKNIEGGNIIQIGYSLEDEERLAETNREIFGTALVVILISGSFLGWFVVRRAMAGVERVTQTAVSISRGDLTQRVPPGHEGEEIDRLTTAFNEMLERIQSLVAELKEVTNNIAHDLRSPITRIRGIAETTLTGKQTVHEYREMAGMVVEESDRLVGMISTMLEIAETDSGVAQQANVPVDVAGIARSAHELFQPVAEDKGISLQVDTPQRPVLASGDVRRLQRVIANLLDNALRYTPEGGKVSLSVEQDQPHVVISVTDSGVGIDETELPRIFERFYRGDRSRSTPGSGLGLSLARTIVRAHGGEITVTSSPGMGSTFTVLLPRFSLPQ